MTYLIAFDHTDFWVGYLLKGILHWRGWNNSSVDFYQAAGMPYESAESLIATTSKPGYTIAVVSSINPYLLCTDITTFKHLVAVHNPETLL